MPTIKDWTDDNTFNFGYIILLIIFPIGLLLILLYFCYTSRSRIIPYRILQKCEKQQANKNVPVKKDTNDIFIIGTS